ncbi:MAG: UDP-4-amino-4,6-dideoxy-N-acetyl-beta-L-altrosamine transaminase [Rhodospirillaceae bacterium]|nr:UDP-4-amino-4,6-dideoxy-N-acetyl-beta-L-altrosamine transaminase [Rhodospirillaceae bacterium]
MTTPSQPMLPYGRAVIDEDDIAAVAQVLRTGTLTDGPTVEAFEQALAEATGAAEAVTASSGTTALHLVTLALDLKPGDQVIVPTVTFLATANAARYVGADVVFADADPNTGLMTPENFEEALTRARKGAVKAVAPVHLSGQCCDMPRIAEIADRHGITVFEDACHALGGTYPLNETVPVGSYKGSAAAVFSFHPIKAITTGEGGAITTNDRELAATMRRLRGHGMEKPPSHPALADFATAADGKVNPWIYQMRELGWNFRASDIHCALGLSQIKKLKSHIARRAELVAYYDKLIKPLAPTIRHQGRVGGNPGWHTYNILIDFPKLGMDRSALVKKLAAENIGAGVQYMPVHLQPYYQDLYGRAHLPGAEAYYGKCLCLPLYPDLTAGDVERVVATLKKVTGL